MPRINGFQARPKNVITEHTSMITEDRSVITDLASVITEDRSMITEHTSVNNEDTAVITDEASAIINLRGAWRDVPAAITLSSSVRASNVSKRTSEITAAKVVAQAIAYGPQRICCI